MNETFRLLLVCRSGEYRCRGIFTVPLALRTLSIFSQCTYIQGYVAHNRIRQKQFESIASATVEAIELNRISASTVCSKSSKLLDVWMSGSTLFPVAMQLARSDNFSNQFSSQLKIKHQENISVRKCEYSTSFSELSLLAIKCVGSQWLTSMGSE